MNHVLNVLRIQRARDSRKFLEGIKEPDGQELKESRAKKPRSHLLKELRSQNNKGITSQRVMMSRTW